MKKLISIAMALVMMMAVMVPAFAADLTADTQSGEATVQTDLSGINGDGTYTVTYPATMALTWGDTSTEFEIKVTSQLKTGKCVSVVLADKEDGFVMINTLATELPYALTGDTTIKTSAPVVTDEAYKFNVEVDTADWNAVAFDEYSDTITVTTSIVDE